MDPRDVRQQQRNAIPSIILDDRHFMGSSLVPSRRKLLEKLPDGLVCLELGVASGDFSKEILERMKPSRLDLVDLWEGERYGKLRQVVEANFEAEIGRGRVGIHQTTSVDFLTEAAARGRKYDFIYIDTDHSFATTFNELVLGARCVSEGGYICGHDYCVGNIVTPVVYGVIQAVNKFCREYAWRYLYITAEPDGWNSYCLTKCSD